MSVVIMGSRRERSLEPLLPLLLISSGVNFRTTRLNIGEQPEAARVSTAPKNSLDLLRLLAAALVLYSHQHVLLGLKEPTFFGWNTVGGLGVSVFFFLSGFLVWSSWARDPDVKRFFLRRALRIFPGLWLVVLLTVFVLGPVFTNLSMSGYFSAAQTWRYLDNGFLLTRYALSGVFLDSPYPAVVNGSLWTLPIEFFCYFTMAMLGLWAHRAKGAVGFLVLLSIGGFVSASWWGPEALGERFTTHFEMMACFWWGVGYGVFANSANEKCSSRILWGSVLLIASVAIGPRGFERTAVQVLAAGLVLLSLKTGLGMAVTNRLGDLSYGMYIFAFPVQQLVVHWGQGRGWTFATHLGLSLVLTASLSYVSWHFLEKQALRFKPQTPRQNA